MAGVLHVVSDTNGVATVEMPFTPFGDGMIPNFLSGTFLGDGGPDSDRLWCITSEGTSTNAVFASGEWVDPADGEASTLTAARGDMLVLASGDGEPFGFWLRGRVAPRAGWPFISGLSVDPEEGFADLAVSTGGCPADVFTFDTGEENPDWTYLGRWPGYPYSFAWRDTALVGMSNETARVYLVSDASRDTDGDGVPDALETHVFGTSPFLSDTDGDGVVDGLEIAWGTAPLVADQPAPFSFEETFEPPSVQPGTLAGQNGWTVDNAEAATVQGEFVHSGTGALRLGGDPRNGGTCATASHAATTGAEVVWMDVRQLCPHGGEALLPSSAGLAAYAFDREGHPVVTDGDALRTNRAVVVSDLSRWVRCSCRFDFANRLWDFYLDGVIIARNLALRGTTQSLHAVDIQGKAGFVDGLKITTERPAGLSSDGDGLPDEWEFVHFGTLVRTGDADFDGDGLSDLAEFRAGTDPLLADTDGDGIPDEWEVAHGLAPLDPSDAAADPDGDGVSNLNEYAYGGNPHFAEPDPQFRRPGLRAEYGRTTGKLTDLPDIAALLPSEVSSVPQVDMPNVPWRTDGVTIGDYFAGRFEGFVFIPATGRYVFTLTSEAGATMWLDGSPVISDTAPHDARAKGTTLDLETGYHPIRIDFYKNTEYGRVLLEWEGPTFLRQVVPPEAFSHLDIPSPPPAGYAPGLDIAYYAFSHALTSMPDVANVVPVATGVIPRIRQLKTKSAWEGAPASLVNRFAAVIRGALLVPATGRYKLTLASDDGSCLWLDGRLVIDHGTTHSWSSKSATVNLSKGLHELKVECYENTGYAGVRLYWSRDGAPDTTIPARAYFRPLGDGSADADGDGMPDWWEAEHGLDPSDPSDAALDPDGDGLSNLAELRAGTDPHRPDTDGDGMPDAWEAAQGTCPFLADALDDPDGDGLVNLEECRLGTAALVADTDGDGCPDGQEVRNVHSDPLAADIAWSGPVDVGPRMPGDSIVSASGTWRTETDGTVYAAERAGSLAWRLAVPTGGVDALAICVGQHEFYSKASTFDLSLKVDGIFVSRLTVEAPYGTTADAFFFLPEIGPGEHDFTLVWHNWEVNTFLAVHDLRFVRFGGPDADGNGEADWRDSRNGLSSALDALPCESLVSPLCVEGRDLWRDVLEVSVAYPSTNAAFAVVKTVGDGFYADIPLAEEGVSVITLADRALTNSFPVVWSAFDVFAGDYATNALVVRTGDSLRIAGYESGESTVVVSRAVSTNEWSAVTNWAQTAATPYVFDTPGLHLVSVSADGWLGVHEEHALVEVVSSRFPKRNPAILLDAEQSLDCPALSPRNLLEHDSGLEVSASVSSGGVLLGLFTHADRDLGLVSRLDEGGPISDAVQVTPVWFDNGTYYHVAQVYPDGSQLVEVSFLFGGLPEGFSVKLEIFVSGVTFEDGTRTKVLTASDMDENGHCTVRFIKARGVTTSVCHRTYLYQDGQLIYTNK